MHKHQRQVNILLTVCGIVMLAMVTRIATPVAHDGQSKDEVFVPGAWATTTTENVLVVTQIRIDPRPRSDLRYGARKPGRIQILRRVRRDMTKNWDRVNSPRVVNGKNRNGRLVNERPADRHQHLMENKTTLVDTRPPVSLHADETADSVSYLPVSYPSSTAEPVSYQPESYLSSTAVPSEDELPDLRVNINNTLGSSKTGDHRWKHSCWSRVTENATWGLPSTWFSGLKKFLDCGEWQELAVLGSLMSLVLLGLVGSVGYQVGHWVEMRKRRFFQPPSRIFQSRIKGRKARGWTPLLRTRLFRQTGSMEDIEGNYSTRSSGRRTEVLRPLVSGREASGMSELDRSVPVYCSSTPANAIEAYATIRPSGRTPVLAARAYSCDFEGLETFTPRIATRSTMRMRDEVRGSYVPSSMPEPPAVSMEDFPKPPVSLLRDVSEFEADEREFRSPLHSSDEEESG